MDKSDYLNRYAEGWIKGDSGILLEALDDSYHLDDPNVGSVPKEGIPDYITGLKNQVEAIRSEPANALLELSDIVTHEEQDILTAWAWWIDLGTPIQGSALIKVGDNGVLSERLTYYTKLPE